MDDPFSALKNILESGFHLVPMRNGKYAFPEIQQLKEAIVTYNPDKKITYIKLVHALSAALPHFEKWRIDFESIKYSVNSLAKIHQMPAVNWSKLLSHPKVSSRFQLYTHQDTEFIPWLTATSGKKFTKLKPNDQTLMLIAYSEELGFSTRLKNHLDKEPEFLARLIMKSEDDFMKIANSRLILYLTDAQLAKAITQYLPDLQEQQDPILQVEQLVEKLNNGILSNGRSISTLLRNAEAKTILDNSEVFRIYQSDAFINREEQAFPEDAHLKPTF